MTTQVPPDDRPREKLVRAGVASLGDNELVALLLGSGIEARPAIEVANDLLATAGGITGLARVSVDELVRVSGVGRPRAARVLAAIELGRRAITATGDARPLLTSPAVIGQFLLAGHGGHRQERFGVVLLDAKRRLIRVETISIGTLDASFAHPREVYRAATLGSAQSIVVFHNHPSGDSSPSHDDVFVTARLEAAGEVMGIELLDHIILGAGRYFSFREAGMIS